jgi:cytoskeletal protein CcmA (bactofilin family)
MLAFKQKLEKEAIKTVIGINTVMEGSVRTEESIRLDGTLKGELHASGTLVIGPTGKVEAEIVRVRDAVIGGEVTGKLVAEGSVKLEASAVFTGDIAARSIVVEEGAIIKGKCAAGEKNEPSSVVDTQEPPSAETDEATPN